MHSREQHTERRHLEGEKPMVSVCPETNVRISKLQVRNTYVLTQCLQPALSVTGYGEAFHRQETSIGTVAEYFRPDAHPSELFVEPGDRIEVHEVNEVQGYIHATIHLLRGRVYEISRIIPLSGTRVNAEHFIVSGPENQGGVTALEEGPDDPINDEPLIAALELEQQTVAA